MPGSSTSIQFDDFEKKLIPIISIRNIEGIASELRLASTWLA